MSTEEVPAENLISLLEVSPRRIAQTITELEFALSLRPCGRCGAYERDRVKYNYVGWPTLKPGVDSCLGSDCRCPQCGALRRMMSWTVPDPQDEFPRLHVTGPAPSAIIEPHELMTEIDLLSPLLHATPSELGWVAFRVSFRALERALTCSNELRKFIVPGQPVLLANEYSDAGRAHRAAYPERYLATAVEATHTHLIELYATHMKEIPRVKEEASIAHGPPKIAVGVLNRDAIRAHDAWRDRGQVGEGRLVLKNQRILDTHVSSVKGGVFENVTFEKVNAFAIGLNEALLTDVSFQLCTLQTSDLIGAMLTRVMFRQCNANLVDFGNSRLASCAFIDTEIARTGWLNCHIRDTRFERVKLHDATLNGVTMVHCDFRGNFIGATDQFGHLATTAGARFEDCDFRETGWHQRDLSGATFVRCQFAGSGQMPRAWDGLVLEDCDMSRAEFLTMLGEHDARKRGE